MCFVENAAKESPQWVPAVNTRAQELLSQWTLGKQEITSLGFKIALRGMMGPDYNITQRDVSSFLHRWFFGEGGNKTYDTNRTSGFITYAPQLTDEQKAMDVAIEAERKQLKTTGSAPGIGTKDGEPMAIGNPLTGIINGRKE